MRNCQKCVLIIVIFVFVAFVLNAESSKDSLRLEKHSLPKTDQNYLASRRYIEDIPIDEYQWASDKAYDDFNDIKFGVRVHWGFYSIIHQKNESWPFLKMTNEQKQDYLNMAKTWNPKGFNANEWMDFFTESGLKMFAFTTKHHEGFSMFNTKTRVKKRVNWIAPGGPALEDCDLAFSIMESPFKRDIVRELCDAAHKRDIKIDLYFSHSDWYDADFRPYGRSPMQIPSSYKLEINKKDSIRGVQIDKHFGKIIPSIFPAPTPQEVDRMVARHRAQLTELLTNYGKIDMVCLDISWGPTLWPRLRETMLELRKLQPDVMFRARGIGNYGDYYTPEGFVPGSKENSQVPWFVIHTLGSSFSYEPDSAKHKGARWIIQNLIDCAAKGGNFMVGIGPDENGKFHPTAVKQLKQAGKWLKTNGEGIYATRAREGELWKENDSVKFTRSKDNKTIYVHCYQWPGKHLVLKTIKLERKLKVVFLGKSKSLKWQYNKQNELVIDTPEKLLIDMPEDEKLAYSFKIVMK